MNLIEVFAPSLKGRAGKTALWFEGAAYTFGELDRTSDAVAHALSGRFGVRAGDRLAMLLGNGPELIQYYLGALKLGAIVVPMNILYRDRELTHLVCDAEPRVLLCDVERYEIFAPLRARFTSIEHIFVSGAESPADATPFQELLCQAPEPWDVSEIRDDDPALMLYTSGTTGRSKGALLTHANLASNILALLDCWHWTEDDRFLLSLPLFHIHGLANGVHGALASGCTTFLLPRFHAERTVQTLVEEGCTLFFGVPTMYERLLEHASKGATVPSKMRLYVSGSAPLSPETFFRFKEVFGHEILERYGMSETAMITSNPYAGPRVQGAVGKPLPGVQIRIVEGEVQVRGPNVMKEYSRQPELTREAFRDGWFCTGDLGRYDDAGNLVLCGRKKELIISGGYNIYPQEIIDCLVEHPGVAEAAVIGVPDPVQGELPKAYVVKSSGTTDESRLIEYCGEHLARFKVPKRIVFIEELPRSAMGKLQLHRLPNRNRL